MSVTSAKRRPSGDHRGASARPPLLRVSCTGSPPVLLHTQISTCPDLVEISAICWPSGEYSGHMSSRVELRNCSGVAALVRRSRRKTLESGERRSNTKRRPRRPQRRPRPGRRTRCVRAARSANRSTGATAPARGLAGLKTARSRRLAQSRVRSTRGVAPSAAMARRGGRPQLTAAARRDRPTRGRRDDQDQQRPPIRREHARDIPNPGEPCGQSDERLFITGVERHLEQRQRLAGLRAIVSDQVAAVSRPRRDRRMRRPTTSRAAPDRRASEWR